VSSLGHREVQFTAGAELRDKLERLRALLRCHDPDNICLMCRTHNRYLAEVDYGTKAVARHWVPARETGQKAGTPLRNTSAPGPVPKGAL
jgi:hypothetical protein